MAFATGGKGAQSDINVTPLVDVVLVLLIIFMVVTPLLQVDMPADIPKPPPQDQPIPPPPPVPQIVLSVKRDGTYVNADRTTTDEELKARLEQMVKGRKKEDKIAFVSGEDGLAFGQIIHVMDVARGAGIEEVGIIDPIQ